MSLIWNANLGAMMPGQLDDLKYVHQMDTNDAFGLASKQWQQLEYDFTPELGDHTAGIDSIVYAGMGGSALAAQLSVEWPGYNRPFEIVREYDIPPYVNEKTLVIASSYSGNTEETLSCVKQAEARHAQIAVITAGGALLELAKEKHYSLVQLPKISASLYGVLNGWKGLVQLTEQLGLTTPGASAELSSTAMFLGRSIAEWLPDLPVSQNPAKQLALDIAGTTPVIYSGKLLAPAADRWKIGFNENSKNVAWSSMLPEFNHNEFAGWTSHPVEKPYSVIFLKSSFESDQLKKRFAVSERVLSGRWPAPHHVEAAGETKLQQLAWSHVLGDFVSLYMAMLNGVNPIEPPERDIVETFKKEMQQP